MIFFLNLRHTAGAVANCYRGELLVGLGERRWQNQPSKSQQLPKISPVELDHNSIELNGFDPMQILRDFDYGKVSYENGQRVREFHVEANSTTITLNAAIKYVSWNLNGRVPESTIRATGGDRLRVIFHNADGHSHSLHFHWDFLTCYSPH